jgi:ATP-dependent DNA helicase RecG
MTQLSIFISSVQKEFARERVALRDYLQGDPMPRRFFDVFLFEDVPARDRRADQLYLEEVRRCDIYLGLFGNEYGWEDAEGLSPTHKEFRISLYVVVFYFTLIFNKIAPITAPFQ